MLAVMLTYTLDKGLVDEVARHNMLLRVAAAKLVCHSCQHHMAC